MTAIAHLLPKIIDDERIDNYLELINKISEYSEINIKFRSKKVTISPAGYAILACLIDRSIENGVKINFPKNAHHPFIEKLAKLSQQQTLSLPQQYNYETESVIFSGNQNAINLGFVETLECKANLSEDLLFDCKLILHELMQNSKDHSGAGRYFMYAGPWNNEMHLGVMDMGVSIPAKMRQKYFKSDDLEYILLSLEKGSTTRRERIGGFGLYHFREFLKKNKAKLTIASGNAQVRYYFQTRRSQKSFLKNFLAGTWCMARIPLEKIK